MTADGELDRIKAKYGKVRAGLVIGALALSQKRYIMADVADRISLALEV
ncbi:MAG: hypothetical protein LBF92_02000 [Synergistaceae bacterium]|jgi:hypothetical protein|nr:hypothetical protein [Synergistaceae bacterium]